jgi:hypothetical protein
MPVPWEALIPFGELRQTYYFSSPTHIDSTGLLTAMFGAAGTLLNASVRSQNQGKVRSLCPRPTGLPDCCILSFSLACQIQYGHLGRDDG